jgi:uncharacterized protein (TIGR03435 family)
MEVCFDRDKTALASAGTGMGSPVRLCIGVTICILAGVSPGLAQPHFSDAPGLSFDVASVKSVEMPVNFHGHVGFRTDSAHGIFRCDYCNLGFLIEWSFDLKTFQVVGPPWLYSQMYMIDARMAAGTGETQLREMMAALLDERFGLRFHRDQKELPVFNLVAGPKTVKRLASSGRPSLSVGNGFIHAVGMSMDGLAARLSAILSRPVLNRTGIDGQFDIDLQWTPARRDDPALASDVTGAVRDELGLLLKPAKSSTAILVVDSVFRVPTPN